MNNEWLMPGKVISVDIETITALVEEIKRLVGVIDEMTTAPPKRKWVGLTDEEREEATGWSVENIEAKLKEKNSE